MDVHTTFDQVFVNFPMVKHILLDMRWLTVDAQSVMGIVPAPLRTQASAFASPIEKVPIPDIGFRLCPRCRAHDAQSENEVLASQVTAHDLVACIEEEMRLRSYAWSQIIDVEVEESGRCSCWPRKFRDDVFLCPTSNIILDQGDGDNSNLCHLMKFLHDAHKLGVFMVYVYQVGSILHRSSLCRLHCKVSDLSILSSLVLTCDTTASGTNRKHW